MTATELEWFRTRGPVCGGGSSTTPDGSQAVQAKSIKFNKIHCDEAH